MQFDDAAAPARYDIRDGTRRLGHITVRVDGDQAIVEHTEVDPAARGQGIAGKLTHHVLDDLRARGLQVVPRCPYTIDWLRRHPDYSVEG